MFKVEGQISQTAPVLMGKEKKEERKRREKRKKKEAKKKEKREDKERRKKRNIAAYGGYKVRPSRTA